LFLTVPAGKMLWSSIDEASGHQRRYARSELTENLRETGYRVEYASYWQLLTLPFYFYGG